MTQDLELEYLNITEGSGSENPYVYFFNIYRQHRGKLEEGFALFAGRLLDGSKRSDPSALKVL